MDTYQLEVDSLTSSNVARQSFINVYVSEPFENGRALSNVLALVVI